MRFGRCETLVVIWTWITHIVGAIMLSPQTGYLVACAKVFLLVSFVLSGRLSSCLKNESRRHWLNSANYFRAFHLKNWKSLKKTFGASWRLRFAFMNRRSPVRT